jgi:nitrate/nitrite-specific signal transduction histidine kinase
MTKETEREPTYVRKVQEDTRRYIQSLLSENETLRTVLARMESEKLRMEEEVLASRQQLKLHRKEQLRLEQQLVEIEADNQRVSQGYTDIEQQNTNLANLYVSSYRLHGTLDRPTVLEVIQEILINLVGSEEIGVFVLDNEQSKLSLITSFGIDAERYTSVPVKDGVIGRVARTGESFFGEGDDKDADSSTDDTPTACVAMKVDGQVTGVIAVFRLLSHKPGLESLDHELFDLLATHAAIALYCTELHAKTGTEMKVTP